MAPAGTNLRWRTTWAAVCLVAGAMVAHAAAAADWVVAEERWYQMLLAGTPCGFTHEVVEKADGKVRSSTQSEMRLGRMGQAVVVKSRTAFTETSDGKPIEAVIEKETGAAPVRTRWLFNADSLDIVDEQGGRTSARRVKLPTQSWLTPGAAREFVRRRVTGGAESLSYWTVDPESGPEAVRVDSKRVGKGSMQVEGRTLSTTQWESRNSMISKPSTEELSADGVLLLSRSDLGVGVLEARLTSKDVATSGKGSAEVMARTFVPLKQDGSALWTSRQAKVRLVSASGKLGTLPTAGAQTFTRVGPAEATVALDVSTPQKAERGEDKDQRYQRASVMVDSDDPRIAALADKALAGVPAQPMARIAALRTAVAKHLVNKNLASGFATASEAVVSRAGDCTEHAVLLAALLRHAGIPSRVASGLLYVTQVGQQRNAYGWHMWTQALVDGAWVDADAVLPADGPIFSAGHLLVATSAADGATMDADFARVVELIGDLQIQLLSVNGAPAGAKP